MNNTLPGKSVTHNRNKYVGGSDLPALLDISPYKTQFELAKEKMGITPVEFKGNEYTRYGQLMEPAIRMYVSGVLQKNFIEDTSINEELHIRSNCDGMDVAEKVLLEVKTNSGKADTKQYEVQMQLYMFQFDLVAGYLAEYTRPEDFYTGVDYDLQNDDMYFNTDFEASRCKITPIQRDDKQIEEILYQINLFWKRCEKLKGNPDMTEGEYYLSVQQAGISASSFKKLVVTVENIERRLQKVKKVEEELKEKKQKLYDAMEKYALKKFITPTVLISKVDPTLRESVDSKKLKSDYPEVFDTCKKKSKVKGYVKITLREEKDNGRKITGK